LSFIPPHHAPLPLMPSSTTESWFAIRIKGSFATQSFVSGRSIFDQKEKSWGSVFLFSDCRETLGQEPVGSLNDLVDQVNDEFLLK
jgi:hypothetical protein